MSGIFAPSPADESFKVLRVINSEHDHNQVSIENGDGFAYGEFDKQYVHLSGYAGPHNPWIFAAAPELFDALGDLLQDACELNVATDGVKGLRSQRAAVLRSAKKAISALAKARGEASA